MRITSMLSVLTMRRKMGNFISTIPWWNLSVIPSCCLTASIGVIRYPVILVHLSKNIGFFSDYQSLDFICLPSRREPTESELLRCRNNWSLLKVQNVCKANYICSGQNCLPDTKESISQRSIFENQVKKFVNSGKGCHVGILNAFPLFLYEYFPS